MLLHIAEILGKPRHVMTRQCISIYCNVKEHMFCATIVPISYDFISFFNAHNNNYIGMFFSIHKLLPINCEGLGYFSKTQ